MCVFLLSLVLLESNGTLYVYQVSQQFVCQFKNLYSLTCTLSDYRGVERFVLQSENQQISTGTLYVYQVFQQFVCQFENQYR